MKCYFIAPTLMLVGGLSWGQEIRSEVPGLLFRTAGCVGSELNHMGGTIFNRTEETVFGNYKLTIYDSFNKPLFSKTEPFISYPRQSKKFNIRVDQFNCTAPHFYQLKLTRNDENTSDSLAPL